MTNDDAGGNEEKKTAPTPAAPTLKGLAIENNNETPTVADKNSLNKVITESKTLLEVYVDALFHCFIVRLNFTASHDFTEKMNALHALHTLQACCTHKNSVF